MSTIKSFSVGNGDMFFIKHNSDNFSIVDCCMCEENEAEIVKELKSESKGKGVTRFISTHPDDDHIAGLVRLNEEMPILNFYCVKNEATKPDETDDFEEYCTLRDDTRKAFYIFKGCSRRWMNQDDEERKSSGISILWPDTDNADFGEELERAKNGECPNNICPIVRYEVAGGVKVLWMGDLETEFMEKIQDEIKMRAVDILFAPHHGRDSGEIPKKWLEDMVPRVVVIGEAPSTDLNYYAGYNTITQNSAGDITLDCVAGKAHVYVSNEDYSVAFLDDEEMPDTLGKYIGTLQV